MRPGNLHITLHFIGNVSEEKFDCLDQAAQAVKVEPFELVLDQYGYFYKAKTFWMGCHEIPQQLKKWYEILGCALSSCDYQIDKRPYAPHVTLMRKLNKPGIFEGFQPIWWRVNEFVLVESVSVDGGMEYRVVKRY